MQTDPVGYEDQMNLYAYVGNDPVNLIDPTGKSSMSTEHIISTYNSWSSWWSFSDSTANVIEKIGVSVDKSATPTKSLSKAQIVGAIAGLVPGYGALTVSLTANIVDMVDTGSSNALAGTSASQAVNQAGKNAKGWKSKLAVTLTSAAAGASASNKMKKFEEQQVQTQQTNNSASNSDNGMSGTAVKICSGMGAQKGGC